MRALVGCEYSGRTRQALRNLGVDAWSCDLLPSDDNSPYHHQGDVLALLSEGWDLAIFHPWQFGHPEQKTTCLWLHDLPPLVPTKNVREEMLALPKNQRERLHYLSPGPDRWKERSRTFPGIAQAMAEQWTSAVSAKAEAA